LVTLQRILAVVVIALMLWLPRCSASSAGSAKRTLASADQLIQGNTEFALALYKQVAAREGNIVVSPLSVSLATGMLYAGAAGSTATEIGATARFRLPEETLHSELAGLADELGWRVTKGRATLAFANGIWLDRRCQPSADYMTVVSEFYHAAVETVDFRDGPMDAAVHINDFVSERTHGKIRSVVAPEMFTDMTRVVLANTVYLLAPWEDEFSEASTRQEAFHLADGKTVSAAMMHREGTTTHYYEDKSVQIIELPYQGSGLSMLVVLPKSDHSLADLESRLTPAVLSGWVENLAGKGVKITLPRFEVAQQIDLIPLLESMGMRSAFQDGSADLPGLCSRAPVFVDRASHHVELGITERGTEAAAATVYSGTIGAKVDVEPVVSFRADRPFVYMVRDMKRGTILFMGRVADPTK
jgi:serpin B